MELSSLINTFSEESGTFNQKTKKGNGTFKFDFIYSESKEELSTIYLQIENGTFKFAQYIIRGKWNF